ncbi:MAG TPA: hypothetical protein DCE41_17335 [Cytophagales bacterium]|nr:hypothetical protein [Cytophagales bacterium]HAP63386.1 hypothetical protein [Cytophagales bacterium]
MSVLSPKQLSTVLNETRPGIWQPSSIQAVSYPSENHQLQDTHQDQSFWYKHRERCLQAIFQHFPTPQLLDIGGSNGKLAQALPDTHVTLLEPGELGVARAEQDGQSPIIHADLFSAQIHQESLPAAGMFDVLEHIEDDEAFIAEVYRILQPGGRLYLTVPALPWLWSPFDESVGHYRRYLRKGLNTRLKEAGFQIQFSSYLFSPMPVPVWIIRKLRSFKGKAKNDKMDHASKEGGLGKLVYNILSFERTFIKRKRVLPLGSSLVVVAQKSTP